MIIIVDDDENDRYLARRVIKDVDAAQYVVEMQDGEEMVALLDDEAGLAELVGRAPEPIFVFLDIKMPRVTGFEVLEQLEAWRARTGQDRFFVVMMLTSSSNEEEQARARAFPFVKEFVVKPLEEDQLEEILRSYYPPAAGEDAPN